MPKRADDAHIRSPAANRRADKETERGTAAENDATTEHLGAEGTAKSAARASSPSRLAYRRANARPGHAKSRARPPRPFTW